VERFPPPSAGWALALLIALPFAAAAAGPLLRGARLRRVAWWPAAAVAALCLSGFVWLRASHGEVRFVLPWIPAWNLDLRLRLDGLAFLFAVLVTGIGVAIAVYSARYLDEELRNHRSTRSPATFHALLLFFLGSMLGLICADELFTLYAFWEATSVSSFLLIGLHLHERRARAAAIEAFAITAGAGLLLFLAFICIAAEAGASALPTLAERKVALATSPLAPWIGLFLVVGAAAKSAQAPLHFWLPSAMVAPTPVSAFLHSATMVAGGVFLLARLGPLHDALPGFRTLVVALGAITMLAGGIGATGAHRLKAILAWSTIAQYGFVTLLLGLGAWGAATFAMAGHAVLKAGLFLVAGVVTRATGETDVRRLGALARAMPVTAGVTFVLALGLAGLPPSVGFWMKELTYGATIDTGVPWIATASFVAGTLTLVYMLRFCWRVFVRRATTRRPLRARRAWLLGPPLVLALLSLAWGIAPGLLASLTDPAAASAAGRPIETEATVGWPPHGAFWLGLASLAVGAAIFAWMERRGDAQVAAGAARFGAARAALPPAVLFVALVRAGGPGRTFRRSLPALDAFGRFLARVQTGRLVHYLLFLAAVPIASALWLLPRVERWPELLAIDRVSRSGLALGTLAAAAVGLALAAAIVRSHIASILMVGVVGFVLALIFALLRAPDVALVQVAVETVGALLLLLVLSRIRMTIREAAMSPQGSRPRAGRIATLLAAGAAGAMVAATSLAVQANLGDPALGRAFFERSAAIHVDAVVTAVLVDFRGLDTFVEIVVFAAAALGTALLLARGASGRAPGRQATRDGRPAGGVLRTTTRLVFPVVLIFAGEHIINAATAPGEGFSGGLLTALSIVLLYVGMGYAPVERALPAFGRWGMVAGIGLVLATGLAGRVFRGSFLAHLGPTPTIGGEEIHLTTHALFDLGIFLVVSSGVLAIFRAVGQREELP